MKTKEIKKETSREKVLPENFQSKKLIPNLSDNYTNRILTELPKSIFDNEKAN